MYGLDILQYQWLTFALLGALALVGAMVLAYIALWRGREEAVPDRSVAEEAATEPTRVRRGSFMPWILILTYAAAVAYGIVYTIMKAMNPPNW